MDVPNVLVDQECPMSGTAARVLSDVHTVTSMDVVCRGFTLRVLLSGDHRVASITSTSYDPSAVSAEMIGRPSTIA